MVDSVSGEEGGFMDWRRSFDGRSNVHRVGSVPRAYAQNCTVLFEDKTFFIVVEAEHSEVGMKFKLKKENMMVPIADAALEVDPKIPGLAATTKWWKKLMEKDSVAIERRYNVVKATVALMRDKPENGAALLRWLKQKRIFDVQKATAVDVTSASTNR